MTLYDEAKQLLKDNREALDRISEALLERETLDGAELDLLLEGKPLPPLPSPVSEEKAESDSEVEPAAEKTSDSFPGEELPDPEPVPG